jgi:hypothetical protein
MQIRRMLAPALLAVALPSAASAQTSTLDEGTFRLLVGGREVGTETFTIRQSGSGERAVVIAQGRVVLDGAAGAEQVTSSLQLSGATLQPAAYDLQVEGGSTERIAGRVVGGRFSARIVRPAGEQMREYLVSDGAVIADEGVAHQYYFLAQRVGTEGGRVPLVIPRTSRQVWAQVTVHGNESVEIGGRTVQARRLEVAPQGGAAAQVWVDSSGRVLRVSIPSSDYVAERTALP